MLAAATIAALMLTTWVASIVVRDASIVDPVWPLGFVAVAWVVLADAADQACARQWLIVAMVTIWGLRLAAYLAWRRRGQPEDFRYRAMRRRWGPNFWLISLGTVFALQGALMWVVSLPIQFGVHDTGGRGPVLTGVGITVWLVGFVFETVGDAQLARFKRSPANAGAVMDRGLWRYTRHPNYFGDACVWWGIAICAASAHDGAIGIVGAAFMTVLLRRVSGVTLLEKSLTKRRAGYDDYVRRTSPFLPRPPTRDR